MKKKISLGLILIFAFVNLLSAFAQDNPEISREQAIEKIKDKFDTSTYDHFNINYNEISEKAKVWELSWSTSARPYKSLRATVDAKTGNILSINMYESQDPNAKTGPIPKYNKRDALKIAENFAKKVQPDEFAKTVLQERQLLVKPLSSTKFSSVYTFNFVRTENNIPVEGNGITITVDGYTGHIKNYYFTWNRDPLPSAENLISFETAEKIFKNEVGLKLIYNRYFDYKTQEENIKLVYKLDEAGFLIDAETGEIIKNEYGLYDMGTKEEVSLVETELTPAEQKELEDAKNFISKEDAIKIIKKYISIPKEYSLKSAGLYKDYSEPEQKVWKIQFEKEDKEKGNGWIFASVNAVTAELLSFNTYEYEENEDFKQNYDRTSARKKADDFLKKLWPERFENVELDEPEREENLPEKVRNHYFNYTRIVNNIPYPANGFSISVDAQTGKIKSYSMAWHERDFPGTEGILAQNDAENYFLRDIGLELIYTPVYDRNDRTRNYKLVYKVKPFSSYTFDAFNFTPLDYSGNPVEEEVQTAFDDIEGHWAQKDIQLLIDLGIIKSADTAFRPDEYVTEGDFIKLLMISKNQRIYHIDSDSLQSTDESKQEEIQKYIEAAEKLGWVKPGEAQAQRFLSREKASAFVIRAMGFEKAAKLSNIYKDTLKDADLINPDYKGHVILSTGFKIMSDEDGAFFPKKTVSRAEAAVIIARMLKTESE